ncbi:MAG: hypothetical protein RL060_892 [Bacteroidota bacterium]|jgi:hypothetical protein
MQTASIAQIKKQLQSQTPAQLSALCLALAKYKKENKEVLDYLLFQSHDEANYSHMVKAEIALLFEDINQNSTFFIKKSLRKIVRMVNKYSKFSGKPLTAIELMLFFCTQLKHSGIDYRATLAIAAIYQQQLKKIKKEIAKLHEDLQFDYEQELEALY